MFVATDAVLSTDTGTPQDLAPVKPDSPRAGMWNWPNRGREVQ